MTAVHLNLWHPSKNVVFDKYQGISAKDHGRMWQSIEVVIDYDFSIEIHLPKRDAIIKSKSNKVKLVSVLGTFNLGENTAVETGVIVLFHGEADVTMVTFLLEASESSQSVTRILSDDTDVFILLAYWVNPADLQCKVQMEHWDGSVLDINAICADLGQKCLQL